MSIAWLGMGSNINAENHIRAGIDELREKFENVSLSPIYSSTSVGFSGNDFINISCCPIVCPCQATNAVIGINNAMSNGQLYF